MVNWYRAAAASLDVQSSAILMDKLSCFQRRATKTHKLKKKQKNTNFFFLRRLADHTLSDSVKGLEKRHPYWRFSSCVLEPTYFHSFLFRPSGAVNIFARYGWQTNMKLDTFVLAARCRRVRQSRNTSNKKEKKNSFVNIFVFIW